MFLFVTLYKLGSSGMSRLDLVLIRECVLTRGTVAGAVNDKGLPGGGGVSYIP